MALDFPNSPALNDTYTSGTRTWKWDGTAWGLTASGIVGPAGDWTTAQTVVTKTANYTLVASDVGKLILMNVGSACTLTVPSGLGLTQGQRIDIIQIGAGQVTVTASSTTISGTPTLKLRTQYSSATLIVGTSANTYYLVGDLAAS